MIYAPSLGGGNFKKGVFLYFLFEYTGNIENTVIPHSIINGLHHVRSKFKTAIGRIPKEYR
ncbi:hypothetical protein GCM10027340_26430 [Marinomonas epiphytica]